MYVKTLLTSLLFMASPAFAEFTRVSDGAQFQSIVQGRSLSNRLYGVTLSVNAGGTLSGAAMGWDITGTWSWQDGYFCREMNWGGDTIPYNCQLVEQDGNMLRFTVDRGAGQSAKFRLN